MSGPTVIDFLALEATTVTGGNSNPVFKTNGNVTVPVGSEQSSVAGAQAVILAAAGADIIDVDSLLSSPEHATLAGVVEYQLTPSYTQVEPIFSNGIYQQALSNGVLLSVYAAI